MSSNANIIKGLGSPSSPERMTEGGVPVEELARAAASYGLDRLAAGEDAPVVACEGEKTADAASDLRPD